jgi:hypothetical protein
VLLPGTCGVIAASATDPRDPEPRIDHRVDLAPHPAGPTGCRMETLRTLISSIICSSLWTCAGQHLLGHIGLEGRLGGDLRCQPSPEDQRAEVVVG